MSASRSAPGGFSANADSDYEARIVLGTAASGIGDAELVLATLDQVTYGDPQSWFRPRIRPPALLVIADLQEDQPRAQYRLGRGHLRRSRLPGRRRSHQRAPPRPHSPEILFGLVVPGAIVLYMLKFSKSYPDRVTDNGPAEAPAGH